MPRHKLTRKQQIFCKEYTFDWNGARAAIAAGYKKDNARQTACENLAKPYIKEYIDEIQKNIEELCGISKQKVLAEQHKIAFSSIAHLHDTWIDRKEFETLTEDQKSCISEIQTQILKRNIGTERDPDIVDVERIMIKLYDKQKALDAISKMLGYNSPDKVEHEVKAHQVTVFQIPDNNRDA